MMTQSLRENTWPSSQVCKEGGCQEAEPDGRGPEELGFIYLEVRLSIGAAGTARTCSTHAHAGTQAFPLGPPVSAAFS